MPLILSTYLTNLVSMVRNINVSLDDADYEDAKEVKERLGITWAEFVVEATEVLGDE